MKKILTVSLVAMMAVSAARADIASTQYVTSKIGAAQSTLEGSINTVSQAVTAEETRAKAAEAGLQGAIDAINNSESGIGAETLADAKAYTDEKIEAEVAARGSAISKKSNEITAAYEMADATTLQSAKSYADGLATNYDAAGSAAAAQSAAEATAAAALNAYQTTNDAAVKKNADDIAAMDTAYKAADTALGVRIDNLSTGSTEAVEAVESKIGEVAEGETVVGMIGEVAGDLAEYQTANDAAVAQTLADAKAYADQAEADAIAAAATAAEKYIDATELEASQTAQNTTLQGNIDAVSAAVAAEKSRAEGAEAGLAADIAALEALNGENGTTTTAIKAAQDAADAAQGEVDALETVVSEYKTANDAAVAGVKATADAAQVKSTTMSLGAANGAWTDLTTAAGYSATGTHTLSLVDGTVTWVPVLDSDK